MKVLLCTDVELLGYIGDVVEVKPGYARNYLIPYGLATVPSEANIEALAEAKAEAASKRQAKRERLEQAAEAVQGAEAVIAAKANEQGHLFGSVAEKDIATNLREQGFEVTDGMVDLSEHIKEVGTHEVTLKLSPDLTATVSVVVVSEDGVADGADEPVEPENAE
jgi:large subunit ribosomal protein L9